MYENKKRILMSLMAFPLLSFGIALQMKAGIGQSMFNALSLILSDILTISIGYIINALNLVFFIIYLWLRRTTIRRCDVFQIAAVLMNGLLVNFFIYTLLNPVSFEHYTIKIIVFLTGVILASMSLGAILAMGKIKFPLESLSILLSQRSNRSLTVVRLSFDILFLIGTVSLTLLFGRTLYIREGTLISIFLLSKVLGMSYTECKKYLVKEL